MSDFHLQGDAIIRFQFLLQQDYPLEKAAKLAQDPEAFVQEIYVVMQTVLSELKAQGEDLLFAAVQDTTSLYSGEYWGALVDTIGKGLSLPIAVDYARRVADTVTALSYTGNTSRLETSNIPRFERSNEIYMAITTLDYPVTLLNESIHKTIKRELKTQFVELNNYVKAGRKVHILECTWQDRVKFVRVLCGDSNTVKWLETTLAKLGGFRLLPERMLRRTCFCTVTLPDSETDTIPQIMSNFQGQNTGIDTTKWKAIFKEICEDKTTIKLLLTLPEKPDAQKLRSIGNTLTYKSFTVKVEHLTLEGAVALVQKKTIVKGIGCVEYTGVFPGKTEEEILETIKAQNEQLDVSEWRISKQQNAGQSSTSNLIRLTFVVDYSINQKIRQANLKLNYKSGTVQLENKKINKTKIGIPQR